MEEEIKDRIRRCGLKQKYIASKIGITPNYLYMCLSGSRKLSDEKLKELKKLL